MLPSTSDANGQWALFTTDDIQAGNVVFCAQTLIAVVGGDQPIASGAVVEAVGLAEAISGSSDRLAQVRLAGAAAGNVVGVAGSRMALAPLPDGDGDQVMRSAPGAAQPGDYAAITVLGAGVRVEESLPAVGVALEAPKDGLVWVLVNPQQGLPRDKKAPG